MRVRAGFIVALVLVAVGVAAVSAVSAWRHRSDQHDLHAAVALAHRLPPPDGAARSNACHGDGLVACWTTPQAAGAVARAVAAVMRADGGHPSVRCNKVTIGVGPAARTSDECNVIARFGSSAATVFITPNVGRNGVVRRLAGSLVSVAAA